MENKIVNMGTARFLRELSHPDAWWVTAYLFKVSPPMAYREYETYRKGKLLHKKGRMNMKRIRWDRKSGREIFKKQDDPIFSRRAKDRTTAFVIASAADLKSMMSKSYREMREKAEARGDKDLADLFIETFLFPAHKDGKNKSHNEMEGSQRGTLDHRVPFADLGYVCLNMPVRLTMEVEIENLIPRYEPGEGDAPLAEYLELVKKEGDK